jgi:hypothetical protein
MSVGCCCSCLSDSSHLSRSRHPNRDWNQKGATSCCLSPTCSDATHPPKSGLLEPSSPSWLVSFWVHRRMKG